MRQETTGLRNPIYYTRTLADGLFCLAIKTIVHADQVADHLAVMDMADPQYLPIFCQYENWTKLGKDNLEG